MNEYGPQLMSNSARYRGMVHYCIQMAQAAVSQPDKAVWVLLAQAWLGLHDLKQTVNGEIELSRCEPAASRTTSPIANGPGSISFCQFALAHRGEQSSSRPRIAIAKLSLAGSAS
jgi:hypothetical protein